MPAYIATYDVDIIFEHTGDSMNVSWDYEFEAEDEEEADILAADYCEKYIYDDILAQISIVPSVDSVEEE